MLERVKLRGLGLGLGFSLLVGYGCTAQERDLKALLGVTDSGKVTLEGGSGSQDPRDAASPDAAATTDASLPASTSDASMPAVTEDAGKTDPPIEPEAGTTDETTTTETETETETSAEDAGSTVTEPPIDASAPDGGDAGQCILVDFETQCSDGEDEDCDGKQDCEDQDCSEAVECCVAADEVETVCDNVHDDDCDGLSDCDDTDCALDISCQPPCEVKSDTELDCSDGADDDCDTLTDCGDADDCAQDPECAPACVPQGDSEQLCEDEVDDDCDGFSDCDDSDCVSAPECQTACVPVPEDCSDGTDNDCDGFDDCADSSCAATAGCCIEDSPNEICDDGFDNDCDGVIDCPIIVGTVPDRPPPGRADWEGGAVAASEARLILQEPAALEYVVQCRSAKPPAINSAQFVACDPSNPTQLTAQPFPDTEGTNPEHDGLITTQVRFAYPNGQVSQPASFTYYVHSSLAGAQLCPPKASDEDFFTAALPVLTTTESPRFRDDEARLAAPFVNIEFSPRVGELFEVVEGDGTVEYLSLRRRFVLNPDKSLVLMKRIYTSRRSRERACLAANIRKHDTDIGPVGNEDPDRFFREGCDAVVMNKEGAGLCLVVDANNAVVIANPNSYAWQYWNFDIWGWVNWSQADNFMWRKLLSHQQNGQLRLFSPKCYDSAGTDCSTMDSNVLILPDRDLFSW